MQSRLSDVDNYMFSVLNDDYAMLSVTIYANYYVFSDIYSNRISYCIDYLIICINYLTVQDIVRHAMSVGFE